MTTPAGQRWTRSTPTEPGWYWYREIPNGQSALYPVEWKPVWHCLGIPGKRVADMPGEWQGPLTPNEATVSEVIRYDIDNPDHLRLSDNGDLVRHEDYQTLRDERDRIRAALEVAGDDICSEFCGAGPCHKKCLAVQAALTPAGGGQDEK